MFVEFQDPEPWEADGDRPKEPLGTSEQLLSFHKTQRERTGPAVIRAVFGTLRHGNIWFDTTWKVGNARAKCQSHEAKKHVSQLPIHAICAIFGLFC